jgi:hypothetical protein
VTNLYPFLRQKKVYQRVDRVDKPILAVINPFGGVNQSTEVFISVSREIGSEYVLNYMTHGTFI